MTPPVKPYKIVWGDLALAHVVDAATGAPVPGWIQPCGLYREPVWAWYLPGLGWQGDAPSEDEAAALVYQAWLDRTSEGMKK